MIFTYQNLNWNQKPQQWGNFVDVQSSLFYKLETLGINPQSLRLACPLWNSGRQIDYSKCMVAPTGAVYTQNNLYFDGSDSVDFGQRRDLVDALTVLVIIEANSLTNHDGIIGETRLSGLDEGWLLEYYTGTINLYINIWNTNFAYINLSTDELATIIGTYSKSAALIEIYKNGTKGTSDNYSQNINYISSDNLYLGAGFTGNNWDGVIKQALLFDTTLNEDQINSLSDNPWGIWQPRAPVFYSFTTADNGVSFLPTHSKRITNHTNLRR